LPITQERHQSVDDRLPALLSNAQRACHRGRHKRWIGERRQFDEEGSVREHIEQIGRGLKREPRLAYSTRPCKRHQVDIFAAQESANLFEFPLPPEQGRGLAQEVVGVALE
jgi:hypothetical protein